MLHFKDTIEGQHVTFFSNHKPLVTAFYSRKVSKSDRQQCLLTVFTKLVADAVYIRGQENVVADEQSHTQTSQISF